MFQLSTAASAILESAYEVINESEFGYRFQTLVVEVLKGVPGLGDLCDNRAAGQPDCYANASGVGVEIKARRTNPLTLDPNSWNSLTTYDKPRLVAMLTTVAPYPLWVARLDGLTSGPIRLSRETPIDAELESHMQPTLSLLIEALGVQGIAEGSRDDLANRAARSIAHALQ